MALATGLAAGGCVTSPIPAQEPPDGQALFAARCASCHVETDSRRMGRPTPPSLMAQLPAAAIVETLTTGRMASHGESLSAAEKQAIARAVTSAMKP